MKIFNKYSIVTVLVVSVVLVTLGLNGPIAVHAATSPSLGVAATYSILAGSEVTNTGATTIGGDVGISPGIGVLPHYSGFGTVTLGGAIHDADATALAAQAAMNAVYTTDLNQTCTTDYGAVTKELAGATLVPGVYCANSFHLTSGTLTLNGSDSDVWIFKSASDLIVTGGASAKVVFTSGGLPCNVWWRVVSTATFDAGSSFVGNILADTSITFAAGASLNGRALARTAQVTLSSNLITGPTCTVSAAIPTPAAEPFGGAYYRGTINVVKTVINDNGGTKTVADFPLFVDGAPVVSGVTNTFRAPAPAYTVTETIDPNYTLTFSGDCDMSGQTNLNPGDHKFCIVINDDIGASLVVPPVPPLIDVVKVPNPLSLPAGPGLVTYTYTLRNIGTVPVTNITMVGDTCSPINLISGDTNGDATLDLNETWTYRCSETLSETHTNIVTATGWANGISAVDVASSKVVVGLPVVPPLIHVVKKPNVLVAPPGGAVTYTYTVTNPGTAPLSNVFIADNKCTGLPGRVSGHPGDLNKNDLLESNEVWTFTCQTNLTKTTTNIGTVNGSANGLTAVDFSLATVVVTPKLPNTGIGPDNIPWNIVIPALVGIFAISIFFYFNRRKQTN